MSTKSGEQLWSYQERIEVNTSGENHGGGMLGRALALVETAVKTANTDYDPIAKRANYIALTSALFGKYHKLHGQYRKSEAVNVDKKG